MQVLSYKVDSSKKYEEDLTEEREAPNRPISEDLSFQQYLGAKEGCSARFKKAERSKDLGVLSRRGVCRNSNVEEEKMCFVIVVLSVCSSSHQRL